MAHASEQQNPQEPGITANRAAQRGGWLRRTLRFVVFVLLPLVLIGVSVWLGRDVGAALAERIGEQVGYNARHGEFQQQATLAAAPVREGDAGQVALMSYGVRPQQEGTPAPGSDLQFATNTPAPALDVTIPAFNTAAPAATQPAATATVPMVETLVLPTIIFPEDPSADQIASAPTAVPARLEPIPRNYDLVNIVLLGSDEEVTNDNTIRTDTMIIVSINRDTGTVNMMSLPRDLYVWVPGLGMSRLTVAFGWGESVGWTGGGFGLFRDTIIYNFGINVHYYAKVNITEFEQIVDLVGGVDIAVDCAYQDFYPIAPIGELDLTRPVEENYYLRTLEVGYYTMDGFDAQWYARTRNNSSDFDRGRRQQKLVRAIFRQALDQGQVSQLPTLWNEGTAIVETNLSRNDMLSLLPIAVNMSSSDIDSFTFVPTYHTESWTTPNGDNVQLPVYETLLPVLEDFYTPPSPNQIDTRSATIQVLNGTTNPDLDKVAAEVLLDAGFAAFAGGNADQQDSATTVITDLTGQTKGSSTQAIANLLNVSSRSVVNQPDANRAYDFQIVVGADFNACPDGVLPVEPVETPAGS